MREKVKHVKEARELLRLFKSHKKPYHVKLAGKKWVVLPNVFSPKYASDPVRFVRWLPDVKGKSFLEMGCGTGFVAVEAALRGARKVVATDINKEAVRNAVLNVKEHDVEDVVDVRHGDLFEPIKNPEKFDIIFFNIPFGYRDKPPNNMLEGSVWDYRYMVQRGFLRGAKRHLVRNGKILLGFSTIGHIGILKQNARRFSYKIRELHSRRERGKTVREAVFKIYELIPKND